MPEVVVERDVMVPMRDSVKLATDIYRPAGRGEYPVLLQRTPYGKSSAKLVADLIFNPLVAVEHGYVVAIQDARGRFASEGVFRPYVGQADDGYDTVEWAATQSWSSGAVGVYGSSFMGLLALYAAVSRPPHLRAALTYLTGANLHQGWAYSGGALELGFSLRLARVLAADSVAHSRLPVDQVAEIEEALVTMPVRAGDVARTLPLSAIRGLDSSAVPYWNEWLSHPAYDQFWADVDAAEMASGLDVPIFQIAGWYDIFLRGQLDVEAKLRSRPDAINRHDRLLIGPWDHGAYMSLRPSSCGEEEFGLTALGGAAGLSVSALSWFDRWMSDRSMDGVEPRVRYFRLGENRWIDAEVWPPDHPITCMYLHSRGAANTRFGDGYLSADAPDSEHADRFVYDPGNPVPTVGGRCMQPEFGPGGIVDQAHVEVRHDVLVYTSNVLTAPMVVEGPVSVDLYVSTDAVDTDFTAKLVDVREGGYCANVADGILRVRYRGGWDKPLLMQPGKVVRVQIDLLHVAYAFRAGHQIRLEISSSNFPRFDRNLNTAVTPALGSLKDMRVARQTVYHDRDHPSLLALSVMPPAQDGVG